MERNKALPIHVNKLHKCFGDNNVLNDLSFKVPPGAFYVLLGENGSGKTILLKTLAGLLTPDFGDIYFGNGRSNSDANIGYVPQIIEPCLYLTGYDLLIITGTLHGLKGLILEEKILKLAQLFELKQLKEYVSHYSGGMLKKLMLAAAMLHNPHILLLDEPLDGLDPNISKIVLEHLKNKTTNEESTIIVATHRPEAYANVYDQTGFLVNGCICKNQFGSKIYSEQDETLSTCH